MLYHYLHAVEVHACIAEPHPALRVDRYQPLGCVAADRHSQVVRKAPEHRDLARVQEAGTCVCAQEFCAVEPLNVVACGTEEYALRGAAEGSSFSKKRSNLNGGHDNSPFKCTENDQEAAT